jgi:hypothetical protein
VIRRAQMALRPFLITVTSEIVCEFTILEVSKNFLHSEFTVIGLRDGSRKDSPGGSPPSRIRQETMLSSVQSSRAHQHAPTSILALAPRHGLEHFVCWHEYFDLASCE